MNKVLLCIFTIVFLVSCKKAEDVDDDKDQLIGSVWEFADKDINLIMHLRFENDSICSIMTGGMDGSYSVNVEGYKYGRGLGIDLFLYDFHNLLESPDKKARFTANFVGRDTLALSVVKEGEIMENGTLLQRKF